MKPIEKLINTEIQRINTNYRYYYINVGQLTVLVHNTVFLLQYNAEFIFLWYRTQNIWKTKLHQIRAKYKEPASTRIVVPNLSGLMVRPRGGRGWEDSMWVAGACTRACKVPFVRVAGAPPRCMSGISNRLPPGSGMWTPVLEAAELHILTVLAWCSMRRDTESCSAANGSVVW